jgi:hypothetical protein
MNSFTLATPLIDLADGGKPVSTGPAIDSRECLGRRFQRPNLLHVQASGFIVSRTYGEDSKRLPAVWERP